MTTSITIRSLMAQTPPFALENRPASSNVRRPIFCALRKLDAVTTPAVCGFSVHRGSPINSTKPGSKVERADRRRVQMRRS